MEGSVKMHSGGNSSSSNKQYVQHRPYVEVVDVAQGKICVVDDMDQKGGDGNSLLEWVQGLCEALVHTCKKQISQSVSFSCSVKHGEPRVAVEFSAFSANGEANAVGAEAALKLILMREFAHVLRSYRHAMREVQLCEKDASGGRVLRTEIENRELLKLAIALFDFNTPSQQVAC